MLPSDMNLSIRSGTVGCNNKILVSDGNFSLGKNDQVNNFELSEISHKVVQQPLLIKTYNMSQLIDYHSQRGKNALIISMADVLSLWNMFQ